MNIKAHFLGMLLILVAVSSLNAQSSDDSDQPSVIQKGNVLLGGSFLLNSSGGDLYALSDGARQNAMVISPAALFFVSNNIAVGGQVTYALAWSDGNSGHALAAGPRVGYFYDLGNQLVPFGTLAASYGGAWSGSNSLTAFNDLFGLSLGAGAIYTVGNLGITAELSYNWATILGSDGEGSGDVIGLSIGLVGFLTR